MGGIGLTLLIFSIALVSLMLFSNVYTRYCLKKLVVSKLEFLDFVQDTAMVPPEWRVKHEKAMAKAATDEQRLQRLKDRARADYLNRMDKLIEFAKVCTLIPTEAERNQILRDLASIRQDWEVNDEMVFTPAR